MKHGFASCLLVSQHNYSKFIESVELQQTTRYIQLSVHAIAWPAMNAVMQNNNYIIFRNLRGRSSRSCRKAKK
jgi:hypothetical protein